MSEEYKNFNEYTQPEEKTQAQTIDINDIPVEPEQKKEGKGGLLKGIIALVIAYVADLIPSMYMSLTGVDMQSYLSDYVSGNLDSALQMLSKAFKLGTPLFAMAGGVLLVGIIAIIFASKSLKKCRGAKKIPGIIAIIIAAAAMFTAVLMVGASFLMGKMM